MMRIVHPKDETAARYYGQGTRWCTASRKNNYFNYYARKGELYILIPKRSKYPGEKYQWHFATDQYRDEKDEQVPVSKLSKRFPSAIKALTDLGLKHGFNRWTRLKQNRAELDQHIQDKLNNGTLIPKDAAKYARLKKTRIPEIEEFILESDDPAAAYDYARYVIKGPWPEAEPITAKNARWAYEYVFTVSYKRFPEAEPKLAEYGYAAHYAAKILGRPWPEAEQTIAKDGRNAFYYAIEVLHGRFKTGEPAMVRDNVDLSFLKDDNDSYWRFFSSRDKEFEGILLRAVSIYNLSSFDNALGYAVDVIKGRWPELEEKVLQAVSLFPPRGPRHEIDEYVKNCIGHPWSELEQALGTKKEK